MWAHLGLVDDQTHELVEQFGPGHGRAGPLQVQRRRGRFRRHRQRVGVTEGGHSGAVRGGILSAGNRNEELYRLTWTLPVVKNEERRRATEILLRAVNAPFPPHVHCRELHSGAAGHIRTTPRLKAETLTIDFRTL